MIKALRQTKIACVKLKRKTGRNKQNKKQPKKNNPGLRSSRIPSGSSRLPFSFQAEDEKEKKKEVILRFNIGGNNRNKIIIIIISPASEAELFGTYWLEADSYSCIVSQTPLLEEIDSTVGFFVILQFFISRCPSVTFLEFRNFRHWNAEPMSSSQNRKPQHQKRPSPQHRPLEERRKKAEEQMEEKRRKLQEERKEAERRRAVEEERRKTERKQKEEQRLEARIP